MGYKKATHVLPHDLLLKVQEYIDGEFLYIPRISDNKKSWGETTSTRQELQDRNQRIYDDYLAGKRMEFLAEKYFLSLKSIQRIIGQLKKKNIIDRNGLVLFQNISAHFLCLFIKRVLGLVLYCMMIQFICKKHKEVWLL